jgi:hypothetical protein
MATDRNREIPDCLVFLIATLRPAIAATRYDAGARIAGLHPWPNGASRRRGRGRGCYRTGSDAGAVAIRASHKTSPPGMDRWRRSP